MIEEIAGHYENIWKAKGVPKYWYKGPIQKLDPDFCVLEFGPTSVRKMWTYATCGMSSNRDNNQLELHLFSSKQDENLVELLTVVAAFHRNDAMLDLHHTINFGKPWQDKSGCEYGFISLPYLDGPQLENGMINDRIVKFYWLIPVTKDEVDFKKKKGASELENRFEQAGFDYLNPLRTSVI